MTTHHPPSPPSLPGLVAPLACLLVLLLGGGTATATPSESPRSRWLSIQTPHFHLATDLAEETARALGNDLERHRTVVLRLAGHAAHPRFERTDVVAFENADDYRRFTGHRRSTSVGHRGDDPGRLISFLANDRARLPKEVVHRIARDLGTHGVALETIRLLEMRHEMTLAPTPAALRRLGTGEALGLLAFTALRMRRYAVARHASIEALSLDPRNDLARRTQAAFWRRDQRLAPRLKRPTESRPRVAHREDGPGDCR